MNRKVKDADANEGFDDSYNPTQTKLKQRQNKLRQQKSGINQGTSTTHSRISDSVCIYTLVTQLNLVMQPTMKV